MVSVKGIGLPDTEYFVRSCCGSTNGDRSRPVSCALTAGRVLRCQWVEIEMSRKGGWGEYEMVDVVEIEVNVTIAVLGVRERRSDVLDLFLSTILDNDQFRLSVLGWHHSAASFLSS